MPGSKRSSGLQNDNQKSRKCGEASNIYAGRSIFTKMIKECGVVLMDGKIPNVIKVDQNVFLKDFFNAIKRHNDYPDVIGDILGGITKYIEDEARFIRMMLTTDRVKDDGSDDIQMMAQESVVRLILKTQPLQTGMANLLISKLTNYKERHSLRLNTAEHDGDIVNVPQLVFNQLRWLDVIDNADDISAKLLNTASVMSYQSACAIISSLPEIVGDQVTDTVMEKLKELLESNVELTIAILDTLCCLNCSANAMEDIKNTIFSRLRCVKIEELPIVVKFLLQTMNSDNSSQNISCLRHHLTFSPRTLLQNSQSQSSAKEGSEVTSIRLTAEAILHAAKYQTFVAETWIKVLKSLEEFTSTDFVTLIILCANYNPAPKKSAISLLKSKLLSQVITDDLLELTFQECSNVLIPYISTLTDIASTFVSSTTPLLQHAGAVFYNCIFARLDNFCRQEVIGCLVEHVGSFCTSEVDTAFRVLRNLATECLSLLAPFTLFIRGIIDHVDRLTSHQIRLVYEVLSRLAFGNAKNKVPTIADELHMIIRKQLTHFSSNYRHIGVIGAVKMLGIIESADRSRNESMSILSLLEEATVRDARTRVYYLDELCFLLRDNVSIELNKRIFTILDKEMHDKFLRNEPHSSQVDNSSMEQMFSISDEIGTSVPIHSSVQRCQHLLLCPLFKAFSTSDKTGGDAVALASAPVTLCHSAFQGKNFKFLTSTEQRIVIDSLFVTLNLFREHISALSKTEKNKHALLRVKHITRLEKIIESQVSAVNKYCPPVMISDFTQNDAQSSRKATVSSTQEDGDSSSVGSVDVTAEDSNSTTAKKSSKGSKKKPPPSFTVDSVKREHFRELDITVLNLLKVSMGENVFEDDLNIVTNEEQSQVFPNQLLYLMQDFKRKVSYKMSSRSGEKKSSPFASTTSRVGFEDLECVPEKEFGKIACNLLPYLCNHLESVTSPFEDDESMENLEIEQRKLLFSCIEIILEVIHSIILWNGIKSDTTLLRKVLKSIGKRISSRLNEDSPLINLLKAAFLYMKNFRSTVSCISLHSAVTLTKILLAVSSFDDSENMGNFNSQIHEFSISMLKSDWANSFDQSSLTAGKKNEMLGYLIKISFQTSDDVMKMARHFVDEGLCKISEDEGDTVYPNFQKSNAHVLYSCLLESLTEETGKIPGLKSQDSESASIELLLRWNDVTKTIGVIVKLLKEFHSRPNILTSLKCGRIVTENFIKNGMPICEKMFHLYQDDVVSVLKNLQSSTRQLQHLTCHSKVVKDVSLAKQVPPLKKSLETLLFRVKAMLALHNCQEAFWLGNLKNRNIQGEEILSQMTQRENSQEDSPNMTCDYQDMSYSESY